ncbi:unnamed protein product [Psylliodes chrysocephalus]|uniref:Regulatory protein zeste n=1 Tax=Psylliodes chrysocephalus TaxID=3402493 RepID=A0A9P0GGZ3_9CUCU|nr:unnamed protein product [Psylliodes chrysocephala]
MSQEKRQRSVNFTNEEKINLLYILRKHKNIIENKETGGVTWKNKEEAWKNVERDFSSTSSTSRSVKVLKRFYNNKKRKHGNRFHCIEFNRAGGGMPIVEVKDDPVFNLTLDIINKKTVFGLHNKFDDDAESDVEQDEPPTKLLIYTPSSGRIVGGSSSPLSTVASSSTAERAAISIKSGDGKRKHKSHFLKGKMWL